MIYTEATRKAIKIAFDVHMGQVDKAGIPYILHPIHLAEQMEKEEECIVALLHDTVEDTDVTFEQIEKEFSKTVIDALKLLTHEKTVEYMEYVKKIKDNPIARSVKLADLHHNSDITRLLEVTSKDLERIEKYKKAINFLSE